MEQVYTVSQINGYIKTMFQKDYVLNHISMKGEVSNCKYHTSGHIYFTLKDSNGQMACVMFASRRSGLSFRLEQGQSIIVAGSIRVYERDGSYQMYANEIWQDGIGILYEKFEQLKQKLEAKGLFDPKKKKPIPKFPSSVGIVTAVTGAAIQDIVTIAKRRNPYLQLVLYPAQVQGTLAAETIVQGIKHLDTLKVDTIIVGRGGGSIEDLWAFNEEKVAYAIFECKTPVISAVGHETDTTIADFVADLRAPTPSAAAELAVYPISFLLSELADYNQTLQQSFMRRMNLEKERLKQYKLHLAYASPKVQLEKKRQTVKELEAKLKRLMKESLQRQHHRVALAAQTLKGLSPLDKLSQGYSCVSGSDGRLIHEISQVKQGQKLSIDVTDGTITAIVQQILPRLEPRIRQEKEGKEA